MSKLILAAALALTLAACDHKDATPAPTGTPTTAGPAPVDGGPVQQK